MARRPTLPRHLVHGAVKIALAEDLGQAGDITSMATIDPAASARATIHAREPGIIAGLPLVAEALDQAGGGVALTSFVGDGGPVSAGTAICDFNGSALTLLAAERVALNFLGHLSGIATLTGQIAAAIAHTGARVTCTRKTIPGLRALQKYAVRCGGGSNHRFGLDDGILIKDNHIAVCGGVTEAIARAKAHAGHMVKIEVEVDTLDQLREALAAGPDIIMLDNMALVMLREAVGITDGRVILEASGGITLDTAVLVAETGVDYLSSGAITHSVRNLDLGLDIEITG
ncbi:MAG: carboxylating nicotinate-nucleotide diphosphorylase [Alphaproteobacteria bacterium]